MITRRLLPLLAVLLAAIRLTASAQGVKIAGAEALEAPKIAKDETKKDDAKPAAKKGKKPSAHARKTGESKYKSTSLVEATETNYRFDEKGNPIGKKKTEAKAKKKSSSEEEAKPAKDSCTTEEPCTNKSGEEDAL